MRIKSFVAGALFLAGAIFCVLPSAALAQSEQDRRDCFSIGVNNYEKPEFYDSSLAACDRFIKAGNLSGKDLQPYVRQRADWLRRKGDLRAALRDFAWAIELNPDDVENYDFRGDVYVELGDYERAIADYNTSIQIKPGYAPAYYARGLAYEKVGRLEDAVASFREAAKLSPPAGAEDNTVRLYEWGINAAKTRLKELGR